MAADAAGPETWQSCDPIVPSHCGFPFPNDVYTRPDTMSATGLRLSFVGRALPSRTVTTAPFDPLDGFSPVSSPMTHMPGATATGLVGQRDLAASLDPTSKTVLLDLDTGVRVAHFAEIDQAYDTFYVHDRQGRKLEHLIAMERAREGLEQALVQPL